MEFTNIYKKYAEKLTRIYKSVGKVDLRYLKKRDIYV